MQQLYNFTASVVELKTVQQTAKSAGTLQCPHVDPTGRHCIWAEADSLKATGLIQESETDVRIICKKLLSPKVCICWKALNFNKKINTVLHHKSKVGKKLRIKLLSVFSVSTFLLFLFPFLLFFFSLFLFFLVLFFIAVPTPSCVSCLSLCLLCLG